MKHALFSLLLVTLLLPVLAHADQTFVPLTQIPAVADIQQSQNFSDFLNGLYKICIGIAAVVAVLKIVQGGIIYMLSDSITEKRTAREHISLAIIGLVLVLSPAIVFGIIDPRILQFNVDVASLSPGSTSTQSYENLPQQCRAYANMQAYVPVSNGTNQAPTCPANTHLIPNNCCAGLASGAMCCGTDGGPGVEPDPGSPAWCANHPVSDGTNIEAQGMEGCCLLAHGQPQTQGGHTVCHITAATSVWGCTLVGTSDSAAGQCSAASGCELQGSGENRFCSCKGSRASGPTCTRSTDPEACTTPAGNGCVWQDNICACGGS